MKIRTGFVSNSSSSSFIIKEKVTAEEFVDCLKGLWIAQHENNADEVSSLVDDFDDNVSCLEIKKFSKIEATNLIMEMYQKQWWGAKYPINEYRYYGSNRIKKFITMLLNKFHKTYLQEALEADLFVTTTENFLPYPVIDELMELYGKKLTYHHLG